MHTLARLLTHHARTHSRTSLAALPNHDCWRIHESRAQGRRASHRSAEHCNAAHRSPVHCSASPRAQGSAPQYIAHQAECWHCTHVVRARSRTQERVCAWSKKNDRQPMQEPISALLTQNAASADSAGKPVHMLLTSMQDYLQAELGLHCSGHMSFCSWLRDCRCCIDLVACSSGNTVR